VLRFSGDPVADSIAQSKAFYSTVPAKGRSFVPDGHVYAYEVTLVGTSDPAALTVARLSLPRGPVLLTPPGSLSQDTLAEIARVLGPQHLTVGPADHGTVNIIGDANAVSAGIETQLKGLGYQTKRTADSNPIAEAAALTGRELTADYTGAVYVVSATDTPAILSLEALQKGDQLLLTDDATMPAADQPIINRLPLTRARPATIFAIGGQAQAALDSNWPGKPANLRATKIGGTNARVNALLVAKQFSDGPTEVALSATGSWQDALLAAANGPGMPLLVADPEMGLSAGAGDWLGQSAASVSTVVVYGDTTVVPDAVVQQAVGALNAPAGSNSVPNPTRLLPM
jgi:hypothetical protein